jgi:hypothetical protein
MSLVEDFAAYLADFGQAATLDGVAVRCIFDNGFGVGSVGQLGMATSGPMLTLPTSSVPAYPVGTSAVVSGTTYTVAAHEPDGTGMSVLRLERTA